ncbi:MAG: hypothetical protein O2821_02200 [Chloroflexi bacterium]|nr:hypothetical protein [Chloroflexota bacterium]MDA1228123.1 hypothetical protein [Chloroflexota bacterium]
MTTANSSIEVGGVTFVMHYRTIDGGIGSGADQGVCLNVFGEVEGKQTEILRFDCFANAPHYHYGPENKNERVMLDSTVTGNSVGWTFKQIRNKLPEMIRRAGYDALADSVDYAAVASKVDDVETAVRDLTKSGRRNVRHNRGTEVIEAGNIRFGLEMRTVGEDGGMAIHVMSDVAGEEVELIAVDCFRIAPHYHYGPRNKNERNFIDTTLVPDSFGWILDQFKGGRLPTMLSYAGYPTIATEMDGDLVADRLNLVESIGRSMIADDPR